MCRYKKIFCWCCSGRFRREKSGRKLASKHCRRFRFSRDAICRQILKLLCCRLTTSQERQCRGHTSFLLVLCSDVLQRALDVQSRGHRFNLPVWGRGTPLSPCPFTSLSFPPFCFSLSLALPIFFFCPSLPFLPE